jgi:hypothetical protein
MDKFNEQGPAPHVHDLPKAYYTTTVPVTVPLNVPSTPLAPAPKPALKHRWLKLDRPHPLLWLALALSTLAIILGVPKGTLPTITGRHRELRVSHGGGADASRPRND